MTVLLLAAALECQPLTEAPDSKGYLWRVLVSVNQTVNTLLLGRPDETLSSRWGRAKRRGNKAAEAVCWMLSRFDRCHCEAAIEFGPDGQPVPHQLGGA